MRGGESLEEQNKPTPAGSSAFPLGAALSASLGVPRSWFTVSVLFAEESGISSNKMECADGKLRVYRRPSTADLDRVRLALRNDGDGLGQRRRCDSSMKATKGHATVVSQTGALLASTC